MAKAVVKAHHEPNLASVVTELINQYEYDDMDLLVKDVIARIPQETWREFCYSALRAHVATVARSSTSNVMRQPAPSKWGAVKRSLFNQMIPVPGVGYKRLGDCSEDDLIALADDRKIRAEGLILMSERFEILAKLMRKTGVKHLEDLEEEEVRDALPNGSYA